MQPSILIVEDEPILARNIARYLRNRGARAFTAASVGEALRLVRAEAIDVVILDIELPDGDGLDAFPDMRALAPRLQGIAMSGQCLTRWQARASGLGLGAFLVKPFALQVLAQALQALIETTAAPVVVNTAK